MGSVNRSVGNSAPQQTAMIVMLALLLVALTAWIAARYFLRRIGGYTGDCLGATQQVTELAFYLGLLAQWNSG